MKESEQKDDKDEKATKEDGKFPTEMMMTVILKKPFGLRINKSDLRVTLVEPRGSSTGQIGVGDKIVAINCKKLKTIKDLNRELAKPQKVASVTIKRSSFSYCKHMMTTVETLVIEKGSTMKVVRAIEVYKVQIRIQPLPELDLDQELGLSVKYDNKEQLQVASTVPGSIASIHLRPGDIIRKVNGESITSKTMLSFWIRQGLDKNRQIQLLVETGVENDTHIEMPEDVLLIAQKQLAAFKSMKSPKLETRLLKQANPSGTKHITISKNEAKELQICSDYDERTLKHVRKEKNGK